LRYHSTFGSHYDCRNTHLCSDRVSQLNPADWRPFGNKVEYCLSENVEQQCSIELSVQLSIFVLVCNLAKAMVLLYTLLVVKENPLLTIGDAISSFFERKDKTTGGMCLMDKDNIDWWQRSSKLSWSVPEEQPRIFRRSRKRWYTAVSHRRWWTCLAA
jgi:hypothetical protein